ncbi:MAG: DUF1573 domain-containing protein [Deltaproteobacteria bacterium]
MKKILLLLVSVLLAGGYAYAQEQPADAPDPYTWDFGTIPSNQPVSHDFTLANPLERTLKITGKTNSCECTASQIDKEEIAIGDCAKVMVTLNPAGYAGQDTTQFVYVNTDDPEHPIYKFTIKATVTK